MTGRCPAGIIASRMTAAPPVSFIVGLPLGNDPEEILARVERGELPQPEPTAAWGSDREYVHMAGLSVGYPTQSNF